MEWTKPIEQSLADLPRRVDGIALAPHLDEVGRVLRVQDGVALVAGLESVIIDEVVLFQGELQGQVVDLDREMASCILFGPEERVPAGSPVFRSGSGLAVPVGEALLGRVLDPLGAPLDDLGPPATAERRAVEQDAPGPLERQPVAEPLDTGIKVVDAMIPIGRGQRQLILGDRSTGKTSLALDAILNQRASGVVCVYVSIGSKRSTVVEVVEELRGHGALDYTAVVVANAEDPAALRYQAAYAGCTIAEWFAHHGRAALIVYDDLTRHAEAYRELSLILRHSPSREAYPGDIFSIHARLMERAFKLDAQHGGGSVTALPIVETQRGNIAGFIPTNVISMTDGQIFLDTNLFVQGQLPAVNVGLSVSRVGGDAQPASLRHAAGTLRLEFAQYEEVKGFARFGAILDDATRRQIERGRRMLQILAQGERAVVSLPREVAEIWALREGLLDDLAAEQIPAFEQQLDGLAAQYAPAEPALRGTDGLTDETAAELRRWVEQAKARMPREVAT